MRTGDLARRADVNLQTIRFYERQGLLSPPERTLAGYRCYGQDHLDRVLFIRRNQQLGFTLAEIKQLLDFHQALVCMGPRSFRQRPSELQAIIEIGRERLTAICEKARLLNSMRRQLERILEQLESSRVIACPAQASPKKTQGLKRRSCGSL